MRRSSALALPCAALALALGCGRVGYDAETSGPAPLVAPGVIAPAPYGIAGRADAPGFAITFAQVLPGSRTISLVLVRTDASGAVEGGARTLIELDDWLDYAYLAERNGAYAAFYSMRSQSALHVVRFSSDGEVLGTESLGGRVSADVTQTEDGFVVAHAAPTTTGGPREPHVLLLDASGAPAGSPRRIEPATDDATSFEVAESEGRITVAWRDTADYRSRAIVLAADGSALGPSVRLSDETAFPRAAVPDGTGGVVVAWERQETCHVRRIDASAGSIWAEDVILPSNRRESQDLALATLDGELWLAWQSDDATLVPRIDVGNVSLASPSTEPRRVPLAHGDSRSCCPAAAAAHGRVGIVFESDRAQSPAPWLGVVTP